MRACQSPSLVVLSLALLSHCLGAYQPLCAAADDYVDLRGKKTLSDAEATDLATRDGPALFLNDVTEISDDAIEMLAARKGALILKGLKSISTRAAEALSRHVGALNIGLVEPSDEIVALLAQHRGELGLNEITTLTHAAAKALGATHEGVLGLHGVTGIDVAVAKALASHRGMLGLTGITTLNPDTAQALAQAEYPVYLTDRKAFTEEVRAMLSQHHGRVFLTGVDLPQCFEIDRGWIPQNAHARSVIEKALGDAMGDDLPQKDVDGLGGVMIHARFRDYLKEENTPNFFPEDRRALLVPAPADDSDHPDNPTCVRVDSISGGIVCLQKIFPDATLADVSDAVVQRFGKSDREFDERTFIMSLARQKVTSVRYTFPNGLVRVVGIQSQGFRGDAQAVTSVWICSRPWVEENLLAYANGVYTSCEWAKKAMDAWDGKRFDFTRVGVLPGTEQRPEKADESLLFLDAHKGVLLEHFERCLPEASSDRDAAEAAAINAQRYSVVGGVGTVTVDGKAGNVPVVIVSPLNSTVAGFRPIMSKDAFWGPCNITATRANDHLRDVANHIVQSHFEPGTDKITVVRGQNDARIWAAERQPGLTRVDKEFRHASDMARYEWVDVNGWTVRVCFDGPICFFKMPNQTPSEVAESPEGLQSKVDENAVAPIPAGYPKYEALARRLFGSSGFRTPEDKVANTIRNTIEMAKELGTPDDRLAAMLEQSLANARSQGLDDSFAVTSLESGVRQALAMKRVRP